MPTPDRPTVRVPSFLPSAAIRKNGRARVLPDSGFAAQTETVPFYPDWSAEVPADRVLFRLSPEVSALTDKRVHFADQR